MSPILIDEQKIRQLVILFIASLILAFASGYFLAYQVPAQKTPMQSVVKDVNNNDLATVKTTPQNKNMSEVAKKSPNKKAHAKKSTIKKVSNKNKKPAAKKINLAKKPVKIIKKLPAAKKILTTEKKLNTKPLVKKNPPLKKQPTAPQTAPLIEVKNQIAAIQTAVPALLVDGIEHIKKKPRFSIQVGAFGNQENAQKLVDEIKAKNFDAYISEYVSSKGVAKYNVRFGHFIERAEGRKRLDVFKQHFSLSAYIIINQ